MAYMPYEMLIYKNLYSSFKVHSFKIKVSLGNVVNLPATLDSAITFYWAVDR